MTRRLRLASGFVLFIYVLTHFANHALGLISLSAAEGGREVFLFVWRSLPGSIVLYGAFALHIGLAFWAIFQRRTLRMHPWEATQLLMGFAIPLLLIEHVIGTRLVHELFDTQDNYTYVTLALWVWQPDKGIVQSVLLLIAWIHGCIGLHYWLRLKPWYFERAAWFLVAAVLVPVRGSVRLQSARPRDRAAGEEPAADARDGDGAETAEPRTGGRDVPPDLRSSAFGTGR